MLIVEPCGNLTTARFYELGINLGIVNPRLVVYPEFIPGTTFCVLSTL